MRTHVWLLMLAAVLPAGCAGPAASDFDYGRPHMRWWREARFGMFVHYNVFSQWGVPNSPHKANRDYRAGKITREQFCEQSVASLKADPGFAEQWARTAKSAGMKYIVITSKHHDGFCLWDSRVSDYDIVDRTAFKRDVLKELSQACRKKGIKLCFYHSIMDWHHPNAKGKNFPKYRDEYMIPQVRELLANYGPVGVMWFDGEWIKEWTEPQGKALYKLLRKLEKANLVTRENIVSDENRLQKQYSISKKGRQLLNKKLISLLTAPEHIRWQLDIALYNSDLIPKNEVKQALDNLICYPQIIKAAKNPNQLAQKMNIKSRRIKSRAG